MAAVAAAGGPRRHRGAAGDDAPVLRYGDVVWICDGDRDDVLTVTGYDCVVAMDDQIGARVTHSPADLVHA